MSTSDPQVYRATYSSTDVYECTLNEFPIMRRCKDDWVNATQILKCCNFPKAKRTKILEKGVQQGLHEKIQGGFGRFQGTWIPLPDAQKLAAEHGLAPENAPVLYLDLSDPNLDIPQKVKVSAKDSTPVKRRYKKPKKLDDTPSKKYKTASVADHIQDPFNSQESFNSISRQSSFNQGQGNQQYIQNPQMYQIPNGKFAAPHHLPPTFQQSEYMAGGPQNNVQINGNASNGNMSQVRNFTAHNQVAQSDFQNFQAQYQRLQHQQQPPQQQQQQQQQHQQQPQQQQVHPDVVQQKFFQSVQYAPQTSQLAHPQLVGQFHHNKPSSSQSTNETNWSQDEIINQHAKDSDTSISSNEDPNHISKRGGQILNNGELGVNGRSPQSINSDDSYSAQLLKFFSDDNSEIPYFVHNPPFDFNINEPIDDEGHTPLHWAASIGNYQMIHLLLSKGASPLVVNNFGLNPLSKLISFNNCYELKNFPKVLDDLELCLINTDINGRTPLHYLSQFSKVKTKYESLRYYLNVILNKLSSLSNQNSSKQIDLLKNVLDHQDVNGDTCLHLAAKSGSSKIVRILLNYGARDDLENIHKETSKLLIVHYNLLPSDNQQDISPSVQVQGQQPINQVLAQSQAISAPLQAPQHQQPPQLQPPQLQPSQFLQRSNPMVQAPSVPVSNGFPPASNQSINNGSQGYQVLATPVQPNYGSAGSVETPDTQRTTIQMDDMEEDDPNNVRIDKSHLERLIKSEDNKENIFIDNTVLKNYESTPISIHKSHSSINSASVPSAQPLTVISERTSESTPTRDEKAFGNFSVQKAYRPRPPKLDEIGNIVENSEDPETESEKDSKLPMVDLSSMIAGMINSFSDSYSQEMRSLDRNSKVLTKKLKLTEESNNESFQHFKKVLDKAGIEQFETIDEGKQLLAAELDTFQKEIDNKESDLLNELKTTHSAAVVELIQEEEEKVESAHDQDDEELIDEEKLNYALELSQLQLEKDRLLGEVAKAIKNYGIDTKMYKYRKLISLSCGLKVDDIDGLIDGIEASLMETVG